MRFYPVILYFFLSTPGWAQTELHVANYYGFKDGLNNVIVYCLREDSRGFLWLGTKEGLNRFDGFQFKKYFTEKNNPNSLSHNKVFDILEYQEGFLLFATGSGLSVLNSRTGRFENERIQFAPLKARSGTIVSSLYQDPEGRIWINHTEGIDVFDKELNYLYRFTDLAWAQSLRGKTSRYESWYRDQKGRLWLPTESSGLQIIDFHEQKIYDQNNNPDDLPYLKYNFIRAFVVDEKSNTVWLAPWGDGLVKFDLSSGKVFHEYFNIPNHDETRTINALLQTFHGTLLFTINGICYEMDPRTMVYSEVSLTDEQRDYGPNGTPPYITSISIIRTVSHEYWIGGIGLYQLNDHKSQNDLVVIPRGESGQCSDLILSGSGEIYSIHNNGSLIEVDKNLKDFKHYQVPVKSHALVTELCEDPSGQLWIGSTYGIQLFDPVSKTFHRPTFLPPEVMKSNINVLFRDSEDIIWIGTRDPCHLYCYEPVSGKTVEISPETIKQFTEAGIQGRISSITEDDSGRLWMTSGFAGGILSYERKQDRWTSYPQGTRNYDLLVNQSIVSILPAEDGNLWLSTLYGDGLVCYHYPTDSIIQYTREQGLPSDYIQSINADDADNLWLTTEYGITRFSKNAGHSVSNILFRSEVYPDESFATAFDPQEHRLILGIHDRQIYISTNDDSNLAPATIPLLDRIQVNNQEQFIDLSHAVLNLDHTQKNISIDFTAVDYTDADKLSFAYQLVGADDEWKYASVNRSAQYAALSPGSYVFRLKVADESGNWGSDQDLLSFTIAAPFWKSTWFILCVSGTVMLISFWLIRRRIRTIRYEAELKQKITETEMMALRAQMNPHFIFNCINSIDSLIQDNDKYHATVYLNKFAKLIRCILDSSKQNTVPLANDMETLQLYIELEQFRNDHNFIADIKADPGLLHDDVKVPPLIIQPYVENAILHGLQNRRDNGGRLSISLNRLNGHLQYIIEDNGVGRTRVQNSHSKNRVSYGMQMSSDRVKLFNQEEKASVEIMDLVNEGISSGTRVEVLLKMI